MKNEFRPIGKVLISMNKNLSFKFLSNIHAAISNLYKNNIEVAIQENNLNDQYELIVKILNMGNISDKPMREFLKLLFSGIKKNNNFVKLIHKKKEFQLPDEIGECIDWFIIEK